MTDEKKVPITAKLPESLHNKLLQAISKNICRDKTDCIVQALEVFLRNTNEATLFDESVLREEIQRITLELHEKVNYICELHDVIQKLPDPVEIARIEATNEGLRALISEKDSHIVDLKDEVSRLDSYAYYFKTKEEVKQIPDNTMVIQSNTESEGLIKKKCKMCGNTFFTGNNRKEYCSGKCKTAYGRKKN